MSAKEELLDLVQGLDETEAALWLQFLRTGDPVLRTALLAPLDDEPETDEERAAVERGHQAYSEGRYKTSAELRRQLG